jgi:hypothetical protein
MANIDPNRIPISMSRVEWKVRSKRLVKPRPDSLFRIRNILENRHLHHTLIGASDEFQLFLNLYLKEDFIDQNVHDARYFQSGRMFYIHAGVDYTTENNRMLPYRLQTLVQPNDARDVNFNVVRSLINSTNSFAGPLPISVGFTDMKSFALAMNEREG